MSVKKPLLDTVLLKIQACSSVAAMVVVGEELRAFSPNAAGIISGISLDSFRNLQLCCTLLKSSVFNEEEEQQIRDLAEKVKRSFPKHAGLQEEMNQVLQRFPKRT